LQVSLLLDKPGDTADQAVARWSTTIQALEEAQKDYFIEWRPQGQTKSVFYEVRGPATWQAKYRWIEFATNQSLVAEVSWPIGPLGRGTPVTVSAISVTGPSTFSLPSYGGNAPALLNLEVSTVTGSLPATTPVWAMVGWSSTSASSTRPFGTLDAGFTGQSGIGANWVTSTSNPAGLTNSTALYDATATSAKTYTADWTISPSTLSRDAFSTGDVTVEVWARVYLNTGHVCKATISAQSTDSFAPARYSAEYGSGGKVLTAPSTGSAWRFYKLGTVQLYADSGRDWKLHLDLNQTAAAAGATLGLDYLFVVPAKQRALSPTGKANDANYPKFIATTASAVTKKINFVLSGWVKLTSASFYHPDAGLGGQLLEVPAGGADLCIKTSDMVPEDPSSGLSTGETGAVSYSITGQIIPRYFLGNG
jgi:hypothetical protein